jgi:hypothetical protein
MASPRRRLSRCILFVAVAALAALPAGCGQTKLVPVSGRVTIDNKPLTTGYVTYKPDKSKGNTFTGEPTGKIESNGDYTLTTNGKPGAPVGWYKVIVPANAPFDVEDPSKAKPKWLVNPRFVTESTTPLEKEVVATPAPGAYDLNVTP